MEELLNEEFENDNVAALADYLEVEPSEITEEEYDLYGVPMYQYGDEEWAVTTDYCFRRSS